MARIAEQTIEIIRFSDSVSAFVKRSILLDFLDMEDMFPK